MNNLLSRIKKVCRKLQILYIKLEGIKLHTKLMTMGDSAVDLR